MKLFLVYTMLFVGSIWKNKSGWFLLVIPGAVDGHRNCADSDSWDSSPSLNFNPSFAPNHHCLTSQSQ
jgi:hypothetical protein